LRLCISNNAVYSRCFFNFYTRLLKILVVNCLSIRPKLQDQDQDQSCKTKIKTKTRLARPRPQPTRPRQRPVFVCLSYKTEVSDHITMPCSIVTYVCNHLCLRDGISCYMYFSSSFFLIVFNHSILYIFPWAMSMLLK